MVILHQYCGFIFAAYLVVICLSGSLLILLEDNLSGYRDYSEMSVSTRNATVPVAQIIGTVERANGGKPVNDVAISCQAGCTDYVSIRDGIRTIYALVNPYTGAILRSGVRESSLVGFLFDLHGSLLSGNTGLRINAFAGLSLILVSITGLYLWPGWNSPKHGLTIKWRGGSYRINYDFHKVLGVLSLPFLVMWAITALGLVMWEPPEEMSIVDPAPGARALGIDALIKTGNSALPGQLTDIRTLRNGVVVLEKRVPGDIDPYGYSYVAVNAYTGRVSQVYDMRRFALPWRVGMSMFAIHIGAPGGLVMRLAYAFMGTMPALLFVTAFSMWLFRLKRRELSVN